MYFQGTNPLSLDAKGRLAVPAKYRQELKEEADSRVVVTQNPFDKCLWLYALSDWIKVRESVSRLSSMNSSKLTLQRLMLGPAEESDIDTQGRIIVPATLRDYGNLQKKVKLVGIGNKCELWDEVAHAQKMAKSIEEANTPDSPLALALAEVDL